MEFLKKSYQHDKRKDIIQLKKKNIEANENLIKCPKKQNITKDIESVDIDSKINDSLKEKSFLLNSSYFEKNDKNLSGEIVKQTKKDNFEDEEKNVGKKIDNLQKNVDELRKLANN